MEQLFSVLATQVPDLMVLLIIVTVFVRSMEKRDKAYLDMLEQLAKSMNENHIMLINHSAETSAGIAEMHRTVLSQRRKRNRN